MKTVLVLIAVLFLMGCTTAPSYVRAVEYGGGGVVTPFTGEVGGCSVYESSDKVTVIITYMGKTCVVSNDKD